MGISIGSFNIRDKHCYAHSSDLPTQPSPPNPNPRNFIIEHIEEVGKYVVVQVCYPDCTNYEGNKILVFDSLTKEQIRGMIILDPHFSKNSSHLSPIARFVPTDRGFQMAMGFVTLMDKSENQSMKQD